MSIYYIVTVYIVMLDTTKRDTLISIIIYVIYYYIYKEEKDSRQFECNKNIYIGSK